MTVCIYIYIYKYTYTGTAGHTGIFIIGHQRRPCLFAEYGGPKRGPPETRSYHNERAF